MWFRHDDLKEMLDSNKDSLKLEAMKRIVAVGGVVAGGDHCWSELCHVVPAPVVPAAQCHTTSFPPR